MQKLDKLKYLVSHSKNKNCPENGRLVSLMHKIICMCVCVDISDDGTNSGYILI